MSQPVVLFLCTGNSARSQMAEAFLRQYAGTQFESHSAGTDPKGVNPLTTQVMQEVGIDISGQRSKHLKEYLGRIPVRYLITVCDNAAESCPTVWQGVAERFKWTFEDPAACSGSNEERLAKFRQVRDEIEQQIKDWLGEVVGDF